jgi:hypothetical protein
MNDILVIHAGRKLDPDALAFLRERLDGKRVADVYARLRPGHVRCCVTYRGADTADATPWDAPGQWHWRLTDPFVPEVVLPLTGQQGLFWSSDPELLAAAARYLDIRKRISAGV